MTKRIFRAESGLDAGSHKVINVQTPVDNTNKNDGVNIDYFIRENTLQQHDQTRAYKKHFAVIYNNRGWIAKQDIPKDTVFNANLWTAFRVDPTWETVQTTPAGGYELKAGQYITASSIANELLFKLPTTQLVHGDTITIKDEGYACNTSKIEITSAGATFVDSSSSKLMTVPGVMKTFIYSAISGGRWVVQTSIDKVLGKEMKVGGIDQDRQLAASDIVFLKSTTGHIELIMPVYAEKGDKIEIYDLENLNAVNGLTLKFKDGSTTSIDKPGQGTLTTYEEAEIILIYDPTGDIWRVWNGDQKQRWHISEGNVEARSFDKILAVGTGNQIINLPRYASDGDTIIISNIYNTTGNLTVKAHDGTTHKFVGVPTDFFNEKFKDSPTSMAGYSRTGSSFVYNKSLKQGVTFELTFNDEGTGFWFFSQFNARVDEVDESNRTRLGVAELATQAEVNNNTASVDYKIVTPKLLANRIASESLRGIAEIATQPEANSNDNDTHIITPKKLYNRQATETLRGVAEMSNATEVRDNNNVTHIVNPKMLNERRAEGNLAGLVRVIDGDSVAATSRTVAGTGVYNWSDAYHNEPYVLTTKNINQCQATENSRGVAYVATQSEANTQGSTASDLVIITPEKLDKRRASEILAGIAETATQTEANSMSSSASKVHIITPFTLNGRRAGEALAGIAEIATQSEVDTGTDNTRIISPLKFKTWLSGNRIDVDAASGLNESGTLWGKMTFSIDVPTETQRGTARVATQVEANVISGGLDNVFITPEKLNARRATESLAGIAEIAGDGEVQAGADKTRMITPWQLDRAVCVYSQFNMTETNFGTGETATMGETWAGTITGGSTQDYTAYAHNPKVVSPRGLNYALKNYLPRGAKAVDSDKLDGLDSAQYLRSDVDDLIGGNLTFNIGKTLTFNGHADSVVVGFKNDSDADTDSYMYFRTADNGNEYFKFQMMNGSVTTDVFKINQTSAWYKTFQLYHEGHKPTPSEIGSYTKAEADSRFLNVAGDTMTGTLTSNPTAATTYSFRRLPTYASGTKTYLRQFRGGNNNTVWHETIQGGVYRLSTGATDSIEVLSLSESTGITCKSFKVGSTTVIESDAKINFDKLKGVPTATTSRAGIVQLSDIRDGTSTTKAATENAIRILQEQIDEKADITGGSLTDLNIRDWLRIGNVIIRPNEANKTLDFFWTDEPV